MTALPLAALLQADAIAPTGANSHLFMIFVGVVSVSVLFQTIAMITMALGARKGQAEFIRIAEEIRAKSVPVLELSRAILEESAPKLRVITDNVTEASFLIRDQAQRIDHVVKNTVSTVQENVDRADRIVATTLEGIDEVTTSIHRSVMVPVRQISGLMTGLKAAVEKLTGGKLPRVYDRNEDDFV